jgi:hypothetical protein
MGSFLIPDNFVCRTDLKLENLASYPVPLTAFRVHDAIQTNLPGTAADDDLAIISGTLGTADPVLQTTDAKATTVTQYARCQVPLPPEYQSGETVTVVVNANMTTTVSDGTATVDLSAYRNGAGDDLCATAATTINDTDAADVSFTITSTALVPGDMLDMRLKAAITDSSTGTAVLGTINSVTLKCDIRG